MAVAQGRYGRVTVRQVKAPSTVAGTSQKVTYALSELGSWSITGQARDMIEHTAFGDSVKQFLPGMKDGGAIQFTGFFHGITAGSTYQQRQIINYFSSGTVIKANTTALGKLGRLRFWVSSTASGAPNTTSKGFWSCTGSSGEFYVTSVETAIDKSGLGTISFTAKVAKGSLAFSSST